MKSKFDVQKLAIEKLNQFQEKPKPFTPGDAIFWTDPYIAKQLLEIHLDPSIDAASRPISYIRRSVDWLIQTLLLQKDDCVLDLGCGPGLYSACFAQNGLKVSGVDFSQNSIDYAIQKARDDGLEITYRCQDYLQLEDESRFDAAFLIYGDLCPLSPESRTQLFANVHRALKPGGYFILDVSTPLLHHSKGLKNQWHVSQNSFWRPGWHLVLEQGFVYENNVILDQYIIVEENGKITVYRNWFQDYTPDSIKAEIRSNKFNVESLWSDLCGTPLENNSKWIGVIARKAN